MTIDIQVKKLPVKAYDKLLAQKRKLGKKLGKNQATYADWIVEKLSTDIS
jgi:hypothetical protein